MTGLEAVGVVLSVTCVAGLAHLIHRRVNVTLLATPFLAVCLTSILLMTAALFDLLFFGVVTTLIIGNGLLIVALWKWRGRKSSDLSFRDAIFAFAALLPFFIVLLAVPQDFHFWMWDEFSHWALASKWIIENGALWGNDSAIAFRHYPAGQSISHLIAFPFGDWSEASLLIWHTWLCLLAVLAIAGLLLESKVHAVVAFNISWPLPLVVALPLFSITNDVYLGVVFAAVAVLCLRLPPTLASGLLIGVATGYLVSLKEIAAYLAVVVIATRAVVLWHTQRKFSSVIGGLLLPIAGAGLSFVGWRWFTHSISSKSGGLSSLLDGGSLEPYRFHATYERFVQLVGEPFYPAIPGFPFFAKVSLLLVMVAAIPLGILLTRRYYGRDRPETVGLASIGAGLIVYIGVLFLTYLTVFGEYEGIQLASFRRYTGTYVLALAIVFVTLTTGILLIWLSRGPSLLRRMGVMAALGITAVLGGLLVSGPWTLPSFGLREPEVYGLRSNIADLALDTQSAVQADADGVYFIAQGTTGLEFNIFRYEVSPIRVSNTNCFSLGDEKFDGDIWSCEELHESVDQAGVIAIYRADDDLWQFLSSAGIDVDVQAEGIFQRAGSSFRLVSG